MEKDLSPNEVPSRYGLGGGGSVEKEGGLSGALSSNWCGLAAHLSDGEGVAKMGHPGCCGGGNPCLRVETWGTRFLGGAVYLPPGKGEIQGSLHCATDDEAIRRFGRDDGSLWWG